MVRRLRARVIGELGRRRSSSSLRRHPGFDQAWYNVLSGTERGRGAAVENYLRVGRGLGWSPHPLFDPAYYVRRGGPHRMLLEAFAGYLRDRRRWSLATHPLLDIDAYLAAQPQALSYPGGPIEHYLQVGDPELRGLLMQHARGWAERARLARASRLSGHLDRAAAQQFLARYAGVVPEAGASAVTVSVVLPVWNRAAQVGQAIDSVRAQTLADWELLVVDDGSTDDLDPVAARYGADSRIRFIRRPHEGVGAARNAGLAQARGRYVAWLDSDDTWTPEHLRVTVAFMQDQGHRAAYDILELRRPGRPPGFRTLAGGREFLVNGNHIGQPVLIHERSLVAEVGGYDEQLPRTVDFDFILRMSAATDFGFAPFVGCIVNHDPADLSRITRSHPATWIDVVLNRDTLDWASAAGAAGAAGAARAARGREGGCVVVIAPEDPVDIRAAVDRLVPAAREAGAWLLVVDNGLDLSASQVLSDLARRCPQLLVVPAPSDRGWAVALNLGLLAAPTERVVLADPLVEPVEGWLGPLLAALDDPQILGAQSAGVSEESHGPVQTLSWGSCALRVGDLVPLFGLDPLMRPELSMADLSLRLAAVRDGAFTVVAASQVRLPVHGLRPRARHPELDDEAADAEGREMFAARWGSLPALPPLPA